MLRPTRLLALGGLVLLALLYWKPLHTYMHTKQQLQRRKAEVTILQSQKAQFQQRIAAVASGGTLVQEARRLGLVKPGERLFIVRGVAAWRHSR